MKIIIAGSREFNDYDLLCRTIDFYTQNQKDVEIVSGTARGADLLGERYAEEYGFKVRRFPADWAQYRRAAGVIRNLEMAEYADALIAFWDAKSKGTGHMIRIAEEKGLKVKVQLT